jgi:hypothetical protein
MKQRGITELEALYILQFPLYVKNSADGTKEAVAMLNNRRIKIVFIHRVNYIKVITVM